MKLHPRKTVILATEAPAQFLGFVLHREGRRLPDDNVARFRNRLRGLRDRWRAGTLDADRIAGHVIAWIAHARHGSTWRLRRAMLGGGWFAFQHFQRGLLFLV